jgi:molybdopterin-guanine dinucleotide biosynthesis protein A
VYLHNTTGLILAGGAGRRVGGQDKGLLDWQGKPLASQVAARLRPQVGRLLVSCNRNSEYYATLADATVSDSRRDFQGPLAGLEAAAAVVDSEFLVISPCDTPELPLDLAARLLDALVLSGKDISYAHDGERGQYLCAALRCAILPSVCQYLDEGGRAVRHWYAGHGATPVDFSDQPTGFNNYNELALISAASTPK